MRTKAICFSVLAIGLLIVGALLWLYVHEPASTRNSTRGVVSKPPGAQQASATPSNQTAGAPPSTGVYVSEAIRPILGLSQESAAVRWAAVLALGTRLNQAERAALYDYLRGHEADPPGPMQGVIKNDVILALKSQEPPPRELPRVLLSMFYDQAQDPVIRNYALQHLGTWYGQVAEKTQVLDALWAGTTDADASIQGTALIGLSRLVQHGTPSQPTSAGATGAQHLSPNGDTEVDTARLAAVASTLATDSAANDVARLTALQVCAELGIKDVLPAAVALAEGAASTPLRMSAVAALGALGGPDQASLLNRLVTAQDPRIQTAARAALRRFEARRNGQPSLL
jgi:HEAT repeats